MNFQELIKNRIENDGESISWDDCIAIYEQGALMARDAIIELLERINDGNFDQFTGEPLSKACEAEIETIRNLITLIKHGNEYE